MAIVTLAKEVGSGGTTISQLIANELGYRLVGRRDLAAEAKRRDLFLPASFASFADEQPAAILTNAPLYLSIGEIEFDLALSGSAAASSFLEEMETERQTVLWSIAAMVYELAASDNVLFVGGGAQYLLAGVDRTVRAKVIAPKAIREQRIAQSLHLGVESAIELVERSDREQEAFNWAIYQSSWDDPLHWDLIINTEILTAQRAAQLVVDHLRRGWVDLDLQTTWKRSLTIAAAINRRFAVEELAIPSLLATPLLDAIEIHGDVASEHDARHAFEIASAHADGLPIRSQLPPFRLEER
jgi:cytidylate kinase